MNAAPARIVCFNMNTRALLFLFSVGLASAQQPQLVWEGEVDGLSVIHVRGDRLDVQDRQGMPVQRDRHRFYSRLPEFRQDAQIRVMQGRGTVRIVQQPRPENNFTLSVRVEDAFPGRAPYSIAFFWETSARTPWPQPSPGRRSPAAGRRAVGEERLTWTGRVDDEVIVECRGQVCRAQQLRGAPVSGERFTFTRPLPNREVRVSLDDVDGRGDVDLIHTPSAGNNYTARVRIRDSEGGAGNYSFSLFWNPPSGGEPDRLFARPGMTWSGRVDGTVRVTVHGNSTTTEVVNGAPVQGEQANFVRALPNSPAPNASVRKVRGRGRVDVVEFPSSRNGYRLVFEVNDSSGGADNYEVEVGW